MVLAGGFVRKSIASASLLSLVLAGCAHPPMGPSVPVMPGPGKSYDAFQADDATCRGYASQSVQGQADAANTRAVGAAALGTVLGAGLGAAAGFGHAAGHGAAFGAATGAALGTGVGAQGSAYEQMTIQQRYDNTFAQCMYSKGNQVPGFAPPPPAPSQASYGGSNADLVRATQAELIRLHYLSGGADGTMGPQTSSAIRAYEQANGLPVSGSASPWLLSRLQSTPSSY